MPEAQIQVSVDEAKAFPAYVNSLQLKDENGALLTLDENGEGSFKEYVKEIVLASAQRAIDRGVDVTDKKWLTVENSLFGTAAIDCCHFTEYSQKHSASSGVTASATGTLRWRFPDPFTRTPGRAGFLEYRTK